VRENSCWHLISVLSDLNVNLLPIFFSSPIQHFRHLDSVASFASPKSYFYTILSLYSFGPGYKFYYKVVLDKVFWEVGDRRTSGWFWYFQCSACDWFGNAVWFSGDTWRYLPKLPSLDGCHEAIPRLKLSLWNCVHVTHVVTSYLALATTAVTA